MHFLFIIKGRTKRDFEKSIIELGLEEMEK
jgi:hypothetical protein